MSLELGSGSATFRSRSAVDLTDDSYSYGDSIDMKPLLTPIPGSPASFRDLSRLNSISPPALSFATSITAKDSRWSVGDSESSSKAPHLLDGPSGNNSSSPNAKAVVLAKEQTEMVLRDQLRKLQEELKLKDNECARMLHAYRDRVSAELEDLTATLFEEANKMVREEKIKRHRAEKMYHEANMKLEALQTEMSWRREQMSPAVKQSSLPHRSASLHVLNASPSALTNSTSTDSLSIGNVVQRLFGPKQSPEPSKQSTTNQQPTEKLEKGTDDASIIRKELDPIVHNEFVQWRLRPSLSRDHHLINRIYAQEIQPNFEFANVELAKRVLSAVENNTVCIEEGSRFKPFSKECSLSLSPRSCFYRMKIGDDISWYPISLFARNRIISVCDFFTYIRYIELGLVRRGVHDTWWEIVSHREKMSKARLGVL